MPKHRKLIVNLLAFIIAMAAALLCLAILFRNVQKTSSCPDLSEIKSKAIVVIWNAKPKNSWNFGTGTFISKEGKVITSKFCTSDVSRNSDSTTCTISYLGRDRNIHDAIYKIERIVDDWGLAYLSPVHQLKYEVDYLEISHKAPQCLAPVTLIYYRYLGASGLPEQYKDMNNKVHEYHYQTKIASIPGRFVISFAEDFIQEGYGGAVLDSNGQLLAIIQGDVGPDKPEVTIASLIPE